MPASAIRRLAGTGKTALRGRLPEVTGNDKNSAAAYWGPFLFHGILSGHHLAANAQAPVPSPGAAQASRVWPDRVGDPGTPPGSLSCVGTLSGLAAFVSVRAFILPPWTLARIGACSLSLAMDGRAALAPRAGSSGLRGPFFFVGGNCLIHVRMGAVAANPLRALARAILTQVVIVPVAHKGRVRMRILRSAETCLSDGRPWGEREDRTETYKGDCFKHVRLRSSIWGDNAQLGYTLPIASPPRRPRQ